MPVPWLPQDSLEFPSPESALADPEGLLAAGGDLSPERLLAAYKQGIFPWFEEGQPILWWSPNPRLVLRPASMHVSRSLRKLMRQQRYTLTMDQNFSAVMRCCAEDRPGASGTWINQQMLDAYQRLFVLGFAHSVEVWNQERLVGGLYGLAIGDMFFGESMFSRESNASKLALAALCRQLEQWGMPLIDCQVVSAHLESLGAELMDREIFLQELNRLCQTARPAARWRLEQDH